MLKDKNLRTGIITGIITYIIIIVFIEPLLGFIWSSLKNSGINLFNQYVDYLYKNASYGQRNWTTVSMYTILHGALVGTGVSFVVWMTLKLKEYTNEENFESISVEELDDKLMELEDKKDKLIDKFKFNLKLAYFLNFFLILLASHAVLIGFTDLQLNTSFNHRLTSIANKLSDQEEEDLKSEWALMKSKKDYDMINSKLEEFAKKFEIQLPEPLM